MKIFKKTNKKIFINSGILLGTAILGFFIFTAPVFACTSGDDCKACRPDCKMVNSCSQNGKADCSGCSYVATTNGASCGSSGLFCYNGSCSAECGNGSDCTPIDCQIRTGCSSGTCTYKPQTDGTSCSGGKCSNGSCVQCTSKSDCPHITCQVAACTSGTCSYTPATNDSSDIDNVSGDRCICEDAHCADPDTDTRACVPAGGTGATYFYNGATPSCCGEDDDNEAIFPEPRFCLNYTGETTCCPKCPEGGTGHCGGGCQCFGGGGVGGSLPPTAQITDPSDEPHNIPANSAVNFTGLGKADASSGRYITEVDWYLGANCLGIPWHIRNYNIATVTDEFNDAPIFTASAVVSFRVVDDANNSACAQRTIAIGGTGVDGVCGTASKVYPATATSYGSDTFCVVSGTVSPASPAFPALGGSTHWQCLGSGGGSAANCLALRAFDCDHSCNCSDVCKGQECYNGCGDDCGNGLKDCTWREVAP